MKKSFKSYFAIWALLFVLFNAVVFLVRSVIPGFEVRYDTRFWISWVFVVIAFLGNLVCAYLAFRAENLQKMFLNLPLITLSFRALIVMLVVGAIVMLIPNCPEWIAAIMCIAVLIFNVIAVVKAGWAAGTVSQIDDKVRAQTSFIKNLTVQADGILARAKSEEAKAACRKVYEAIRYSDPMSNEALSAIEAEITVKMGELAPAIGADNTEKVKEIADEIVILVGDRNKKCRVLK